MLVGTKGDATQTLLLVKEIYLSHKILNEKLLPGSTQPRGCPDEIWSLIQECWLRIPVERPSFTVITSEIKNSLKGFENRVTGSIISPSSEPTRTSTCSWENSERLGKNNFRLEAECSSLSVPDYAAPVAVVLGNESQPTIFAYSRDQVSLQSDTDRRNQENDSGGSVNDILLSHSIFANQESLETVNIKANLRAGGNKTQLEPLLTEKNLKVTPMQGNIHTLISDRCSLRTNL